MQNGDQVGGVGGASGGGNGTPPGSPPPPDENPNLGPTGGDTVILMDTGGLPPLPSPSGDGQSWTLPPPTDPRPVPGWARQGLHEPPAAEGLRRRRLGDGFMVRTDWPFPDPASAEDFDTELDRLVEMVAGGMDPDMIVQPMDSDGREGPRRVALGGGITMELREFVMMQIQAMMGRIAELIQLSAEEMSREDVQQLLTEIETVLVEQGVCSVDELQRLDRTACQRDWVSLVAAAIVIWSTGFGLGRLCAGPLYACLRPYLGPLAGGPCDIICAPIVGGCASAIGAAMTGPCWKGSNPGPKYNPGMMPNPNPDASFDEQQAHTERNQRGFGWFTVFYTMAGVAQGAITTALDAAGQPLSPQAAAALSALLFGVAGNSAMAGMMLTQHADFQASQTRVAQLNGRTPHGPGATYPRQWLIPTIAEEGGPPRLDLQRLRQLIRHLQEPAPRAMGGWAMNIIRDCGRKMKDCDILKQGCSNLFSFTTLGNMIGVAPVVSIAMVSGLLKWTQNTVLAGIGAAIGPLGNVALIYGPRGFGWLSRQAWAIQLGNLYRNGNFNWNRPTPHGGGMQDMEVRGLRPLHQSANQSTLIPMDGEGGDRYLNTFLYPIPPNGGAGAPPPARPGGGDDDHPPGEDNHPEGGGSRPPSQSSGEGGNHPHQS